MAQPSVLPEATSTDKFELTLHRDAKFWDSVASRKQKAKRRKARKFVSAQQEQFSIDDGGKGGAETEVDFYAAFGGEKGAPVSGLSDMDLIQQLAELEGGETGGKSEGAGVGVGTGAQPGESGSLEGSVHGSGSSASVSATASNSELQALEDLEKELGLDSFALFSGGGAQEDKGDKGDKAGPVVDDDDLDELEMYLNSLGPSK
jgi:hypothetical protein